MTKSTTNNREWKLLLFPAALAAAAAAALIFGAGLSPLAAADRPALALFAVCLCVPLGAAMAQVPQEGMRRAGTRAMGALLAGTLLALLTTGPDPSLLVRTASWSAAGCLLGAMLAGMMPGAGVLLTLAWLAFCGLPFFCDKLGSFSDAAAMYALQGCPWLGFSQDAFGGDPLRKPVFYLGQWSPLADEPSMGLLTAGQVWVASALALAAALLRAVAPGQSRA